MDYSYLVNVYGKLSSTSKRLEKTYHVAKLIEKASDTDLDMLMLLLQGKVFPVYDDNKIGVAAKLVIKAIKLATGFSADEIEDEWKKTGDLGITASNFISRKKQVTLFSQELTIQKVFSNLRKLASIEGQKSVNHKMQLIAELLTSARPDEAQYIVRTVLEDLRVGVGVGTLRDAIVWAMFPKVVGIFYKCAECGGWMPDTKLCLSCKKSVDNSFVDMVNALKEEKIVIAESDNIDKLDLHDKNYILPKDKDSARQIYNAIVEAVQEAYDITNDFAKVAKAARDGLKDLRKISLEVGKPLNLMLYLKAHDIEDGFKTVGKPAALEYKYDGFRMEIHRAGDDITFFTRRLENVTKQFPDVAKVILDSTEKTDFILDAEIIGYDKKTKRYLPFQKISKRIRRKYDLEQIQLDIPVVINVFDVLYADGKTLLKAPFSKRREMIASLIKEIPGKIALAEQLVTDNVDVASRFYQEALDMGNEGIMMKNLDGIYKPGARVGYGVKIKPVMETLDVVIIGAEWGEGKRSGWFTSFSVAVQDEDGNLIDIGKVSTGLKEKKEEGTSYEEMTELLNGLITSEKGKEVTVKPEIVIEIKYEEIQRSTNYSSGYALRFPRFVRLREDRGSDDISDISLVEELYDTQRGR